MISNTPVNSGQRPERIEWMGDGRRKRCYEMDERASLELRDEKKGAIRH